MPNRTEGLTQTEAARRLAEHGPNALPEAKRVGLLRRFGRQLKSPMIAVLLFAVVFDVVVWFIDAFEGWPVEGTVIAAVVLLNAGLGTLQEYRSEQAIAKLRVLAAPLAWVMRDGDLVQVPGHTLVPGDVVRVEAGDRVPADGVVADSGGVMLDESVLTGESLPVEKALEAELFSGTLIVRGKALFRVTRTGPASAMGRIGTMLAGVRVEKTPLERRMDALGAQIARWITALTVVLVVAGALTEGLRRLDEVVMFAVALAVAAIPEGMPAVVTLTLALGVQRMAKHNALVRRMTAVESLGSVTLIATDKTGTLTLNQMTVLATDLADRDQALRAAVLANDANVGSGVGDPLELALLEYARENGVDLAALHAEHPRVEERPFDSAWKFMRVTVKDGASTTSYVKGAPEVVLGRCALSPDALEAWAGRASDAAQRGHRVLAVAAGEGRSEDGLTLLGLIMLWDPPRPEVEAALAKARGAGVRVVMITGDHAATASALAAAIGLPRNDVLTGDAMDAMSADELRAAARHVDVFARVSPAHKLRLVEAFRADGHVVAMTGDGVNDAPAIKRADVGVAMGKRGSDVAREVADLVLLDDNFATIVTAIEEGRGIYENIQSFIRFTFSTNVALMVLVVSGAVAAYVDGLRDSTGMLLVPLTAVQLLWINFLGDGPPALALAVDRTPGQMSRPPRPPTSALLDRASAVFILTTGAVKGAIGIALLVLMPKLGYGVVAIQTVLFLYESVGKLVSVYPSRRLVRGRPANVPLHVAVVAGTALQVLTLMLPALNHLLGVEPLDLRGVVVVAVAVFVTWIAASAVSAAVHGPPSAAEPRDRRHALRPAGATR